MNSYTYIILANGVKRIDGVVYADSMDEASYKAVEQCNLDMPGPDPSQSQHFTIDGEHVSLAVFANPQEFEMDNKTNQTIKSEQVKKSKDLFDSFLNKETENDDVYYLGCADEFSHLPKGWRDGELEEMINEFFSTNRR